MGSNQNDQEFNEPANLKAYNGYPDWQNSRPAYCTQKEILRRIIPQTGMSYEDFENVKRDIPLRARTLINFIMNRGDKLQILDQLAILTQIRIDLSQEQAQDVDECHGSDIFTILETTNLRCILLSILKQKSPAHSTNDLARYMKLEALWILTNLAYGEDECIKLLINGTAEDDSELFEDEIAKSAASREEFFAILQ